MPQHAPTDIAVPGTGNKVSPIKLLTEFAAERMRRNFSLFQKRAWHLIEPKMLQWNWHMDAIADHLVAVTQGEIRNLMVLIPPRMTKSLSCSVLWPVWHWLQKPETQFLGASYDADLAIAHAVLSRRIIESGWFQQFFGHQFYLLSDTNQKDYYANSKGGYRITTSVEGGTTGKGGDIQLLDDPHNVKDVESDTKRSNALTWHDNSWRSRVNDPNKGQKVYVAQRTHDADVLGHVIRQEGKRWVVLELPMEFDPQARCITFANDGTGVKKGAKPLFTDPRQIEGELLNPKRFNKSTTEVEKEVMSSRAWQAQYQQKPEGQGGLILKRHWWKQWAWPEGHPKAKTGEERPLPEFFEVIDVWDTAFEEDEEADFTARTTWGLFINEDSFEDPTSGRRRKEERTCALLLGRYKDRPGFPELRDEVIRAHNEPAYGGSDVILIEKKASGHSILQEMRRKNLPVKGVKIPGGKASKSLVARTHMASLMLEKGCIYYVPRNWAFDVINECAAFPQGEHDDQVSSCTMAWQYMRRYYDLTLPDDEKDEEIDPFKWKKREIKYA